MTVNVSSTSSLVKYVALLLRDSTLREAAQGGILPQSFFHQHFLSEGHRGLMNYCEITLIIKTDSSGPTRQEFFWIRLLKMYCPLGLNIEEEF